MMLMTVDSKDKNRNDDDNDNDTDDNEYDNGDTNTKKNNICNSNGVKQNLRPKSMYSEKQMPRKKNQYNVYCFVCITVHL